VSAGGAGSAGGGRSAHQEAHDLGGFGESTRHPGRTLATWVDDVRAVLDALHLAHAGVLGWAAGVPHALAVAALAADRVTGVSVVGPWFAGECRELDPADTETVAACRDELSRAEGARLCLTNRG
jgi:pimeloyl-ACP methyl ester carboxylesterase